MIEMNNFINNNSNQGDIIINLASNERETASYWIKKGDICLSNLNTEGAVYCYQQAFFFECLNTELYHCYKNLYYLTSDSKEKKIYLSRIFNIKGIKRTKRELINYLIMIIFEDEINLIKFLALLAVILVMKLGSF